jgi:CubicO group peptidase (beta-lactamase class C family)
MKLGQLMLDDGVWNGTRILPRGWAQEAGSPQVKIGDRDYGYLWWISTYPYKNRTVQAFFAGGNGGQIVMGIPELDLVIAFFGGNYSHAMTRYAQNTLIPKRILPLVDTATL